MELYAQQLSGTSGVYKINNSMDDQHIEATIKELRLRIHKQRLALELTYPKKDVIIEEQVQVQEQVQEQDGLSKIADSLRPRRKSINDF